MIGKQHSDLVIRASITKRKLYHQPKSRSPVPVFCLLKVSSFCTSDQTRFNLRDATDNLPHSDILAAHGNYQGRDKSCMRQGKDKVST